MGIRSAGERLRLVRASTASTGLAANSSRHAASDSQRTAVKAMDSNNGVKVVAGLLALLLILLVAAVFVWVLHKFVGVQNPLLWTAVLGALGWAIRSSVEQKREYRRLMADRKREHYIRFLDFFSRFVSSGTNEGTSKEVSLEEFRNWSLHLTLLGSDEVVRKWNAARLLGEGTDYVETLKVWGCLWLAMRKDCGHPDTGLTVSDILTSFVNDAEAHRERLNKP